MSDTEKRNAVLKKFYEQSYEKTDGWRELDDLIIDAMADHIVRLERILAALREPSEGMLRTVFIATFGDNPVHKEACLVATQNAIRAACAAAEQEVGHE